MKKKLILPLLIALIISIGAITYLKENNTLTASEFYERINVHDVQLVDIRTPEEYRTGHIKKAINIDFYSESFVESFADFNPEKPLYIYCKAGSRSMNARTMLEQKDFKYVYDLKGGITAWKEAGYEIVTEDTNVSK
jgi:rhodanese-related sulfurtransferase